MLRYLSMLQHFMPFDVKDLEVTRNSIERSQSPRIGLFVGETSDIVGVTSVGEMSGPLYFTFRLP